MGTGDSGHFFLPVGIVKICPFLFILSYFIGLMHKLPQSRTPPGVDVVVWCGCRGLGGAAGAAGRATLSVFSRLLGYFWSSSTILDSAAQISNT